MTLAAIARRLPTTALAGVVVGALLGSGGTMALTAAQPDSAPCVVPATPGAYTCTVVVSEAATPVISSISRRRPSAKIASISGMRSGIAFTHERKTHESR